jgi:DNA-binding transcriptional MerR regulator
MLMPQLKSDNIRKMYYSIKDVAQILSIATSAVRFWCQEFNIEPMRDHKNRRRFQNKDIARLKYINFLLRNKGLTFKGAKQEITITGWKMESEIDEMSHELYMNLNKNLNYYDKIAHSIKR